MSHVFLCSTCSSQAVVCNICSSFDSRILGCFTLVWSCNVTRPLTLMLLVANFANTKRIRLKYRHVIPAPVDRTSASAWLYIHPWITCPKISQIHQWYTQLVNQNYTQLWGRTCQGNWVAIVRAVVYNAHAFSARNKCRRCTLQPPSYWR